MKRSRSCKYSERNDKRLDLVLFRNGLPLFAAKLKNPLASQTVRDTIRQYQRDRDPKEPLFAFGGVWGISLLIRTWYPWPPICRE